MISTIEWVSVKDRLPPKAQLVIIDEGAIACLCDGCWFYENGEPSPLEPDEIKYWAEIPAASSISIGCSQCETLQGEIKQLRERLEVAEGRSLERHLARQTAFDESWKAAWREHVGELE